MAFEREVPRVAVAIGDIALSVFDPDPTQTESASADVAVQIKTNEGTIIVRSGSAAPHLTTQQRNQLLAIMVSLRTKAVAEFLPTA